MFSLGMAALRLTMAPEKPAASEPYDHPVLRERLRRGMCIRTVATDPHRLMREQRAATLAAPIW